METKPTKENVEDLKIYVARLRRSNLKILEEQRKTNEHLEKVVRLLQEQERRSRIRDGF